MAKDLAIVLNNGSINSAVVTALAAQKYRPVMVHATVRQTDPPSRRKQAYDSQVAHFKPFREHTIDTTFMSVGAEKEVPADARAIVPVLPALRRLVPIVASAVTLAMAYDAAAIYVGLRVGASIDESARATEFVQVWNEMLQLTLERTDLSIVVPLLELEAWQVVDLGYQISAPLERTWSCVEEHGDPCRACRFCRAREAAFMEAAKPDPMQAARR